MPKIRDLEVSTDLLGGVGDDQDADRTWIKLDGSAPIVEGENSGFYLFIRFWSDGADNDGKPYLNPQIKVTNTYTNEVMTIPIAGINVSGDSFYYKAVIRLLGSMGIGFGKYGDGYACNFMIDAACLEVEGGQYRSNELSELCSVGYSGAGAGIQQMSLPDLGGKVNISPYGIYGLRDEAGNVYFTDLSQPITQLDANYQVIPNNTVVTGLRDSGGSCTAPYIWHFDLGGMP